MVSVVIPTFNGAAFLPDSLQSILNQTRRPDEIVVVDDNSTDNTPNVVESFAKTSPVTVQMIRLSENSGGPPRPLNVGIEAAKSEYITLLDQDDLMRPGKIEAQRGALVECSQCSIVIGRFSIIGEAEGDLSLIWPAPQFEELEKYIDEDRKYSVVDSEAAFRPLLNRNYACSTTGFAFTKTWWRRIGKFNETVKTCTDLDFMLRAVLAGPIAIVNECLFDYRWSSAGLQHRDVTGSLLEATMVRLRAASRKPEWAGEELPKLRHSALTLANAAIRKGDLSGLSALAESVLMHKGLQSVKDSLSRKSRRLMGGNRQ